MSVLLQKHSGLLLTNKPWGIATHSPGDGVPGFVELLSATTGLTLKVVHRLDKETSGAIIFGVEEQATRELCALFERHQVRKRYLFVTDRAPPRDAAIERPFAHSSHIKKYRGRFVSWTKGAAPNAVTRFTLLRTEGTFSAWQAEPISGKPHQIRLHARDLGIPIIGDRDHAGSPCTRLLLHAEEIAFTLSGNPECVHRVPAPEYFQKLTMLKQPERLSEQMARERSTQVTSHP